MMVRVHRPQPKGVFPFLFVYEFMRKECCFQAAAASTVLSGIVTTSMLSGVLDEIVGLLPVVIPVSIGFIALRKGISFVLGMLKAA